MNPTLDGFLAFVWTQLPSSPPPNTIITDDTNVYLNMAYESALEIVNTDLQVVAPMLYALAVYSLGMHVMVEIAQDLPGQTFWTGLRKQFNVYGALMGVLTTTSDEGTSVSVEVPDFVKTLSLSDLQMLATPWGRWYLAIAQRCGSNWGLS